MANPRENIVAMTAPQQMRGGVIISLPDSESGSRTICAAMWQEGQEQLTLQPPPLLTRPAAHPSPHPARTSFEKWKSIKRVILFSLFSLVTLHLAHKLSTLYSSEMQLEEESEDKNVHLYTLHSIYSPGDIRMPTDRENLMERDMKRFRRAPGAATTPRLAPHRIHGNIYPAGLYYMTLLIGNPPKKYYLDIDTGSHLTWLQCDLPCRSCAVGPHELYYPSAARIVDCKRPQCAQVQDLGQFTCSEEEPQCDYEVHYADGSYTMGILVEDYITLPQTNGNPVHSRVFIGCGYDQYGSLARSPAMTDGVIGLSSSNISLPWQLAAKGIANNVIGLCLAGGPNGGGYLFFGDAYVPARELMIWTPMIGRPSEDRYKARLLGIRYGGTNLELAGMEDTVSEVMFDSGASYTYLVPKAYFAVFTAVDSQARRSGLVEDTADDTLPHCWSGPRPFQSVADVGSCFGTVTLNLGGSTKRSGKLLVLYPEGYLIVSKYGNVCLGVLDISGASLETTNILGAISMRGYLFVYDNVREQIGWVRRNCNP